MGEGCHMRGHWWIWRWKIVSLSARLDVCGKSVLRAVRSGGKGEEGRYNQKCQERGHSGVFLDVIHLKVSILCL